MYSGRISEVGTLVEAGARLVIEAPKTTAGLSVGGSVSVNGTCLSTVVVGKAVGLFAAEVSAETVARSTLGEILAGARVNLELPLRVGDRLDGHLVQGHTDAIGKTARVDEEHGGCRRVWIRPPKRFLDEIVAKGSVAVEGVSLTVAELLADRFSVALIPATLRETTLADLRPGDGVNLESDLFVKSARDLSQSARVIATRTLSALPWAGELTGPAGVEKCATQLAAGSGVVIHDPQREAEADVVFAGATLRPESMVFLLSQVCGHTTVPCDRDRLDRLEIPPMPGAGDRHGTAYHVSVDLAANPGTGLGPRAGRDHPPPRAPRRHARRLPPTRTRVPPSPPPRRARGATRAHRSIPGTMRGRGPADGGGHLRGDGPRRAHAHRTSGRRLRPGLVLATYLRRRAGAPPMTARTTPLAPTFVYDVIGASYNTTRRADPRLEQVIWAALGDSRTVLNVGAGTGAYEPPDRSVVAVEPSATMRQARPPEAAPCLAASAESLPFDDASFDAVMAILTVHHWSDYRAGLQELRRVARHRVLILHWDQLVMDQLWLARYFPEAFAFDRHRAPSLDDVRAGLGPDTQVIPLLVPHDCQDGFGAAYWRRPHAYLDPAVRAGISMLTQTEYPRGDGLTRLRRDLDNGTWAARHRTLVDQPEHDCGYRLIIAGASR